MAEGMELKIPYTVSVSIGRTINMGNYESLRVNIGLSAPVKEYKNLDIAVRKLIEKADELLEEEINRLAQKYSVSEKIEGDKYEVIDLLELEE